MPRLLALLLALASIAACDGGRRPPLDRLVVAAGAPGTVYHALGRALAEAATRRWGVPADIRETASSVDNLRLVADGEAQVAFARVDIAGLAVQGDAPFTGAVPVAALAGLYDDYVQIVVRADSDILDLGDLRGRVVSTGETGSTDILASRILKSVGVDAVTRRQLSDGESVAALEARRIDAFFLTGGIPTPAIADLAARLPVRVLSVPDDGGALEERFGEFYLPRSIPAGTYGLDDEIPTIAIPNALVVRQDLPDETAYRLTELLFAARKELASAHREALGLDPRAALAIFPVPLHSGAARYYRDSKPMARPRYLVTEPGLGYRFTGE